MATSDARPAVSLVINVAAGDGARLRHQMAHLQRTTLMRVNEFLVVLDERPTTGRLRAPQATPLTVEEVTGITSDMGVQARIVKVDYTPRTRSLINQAWFGRHSVPIRCAGGTPLYAYIFGLHAAAHDTVVHLDCDMIAWVPDNDHWIAAAQRILEREPGVAIVIPQYGKAPTHPPDWVASTRAFVLARDRSRGQAPLPLAQYRGARGLRYRMQRRGTAQAFEASLSLMAESGTTRRARQLSGDSGYVLHFGRRGYFDDPRITSAIRSVEQNELPVDQAGGIDITRLWEAPQANDSARGRL